MGNEKQRSYKAQTFGEKEPLERFVKWVKALNKEAKIPIYMEEHYSMVRCVFYSSKTNSINFITKYYDKWWKYYNKHTGKEVNLCYYHLRFNSDLEKLIFYKEGDFRKTRIGDKIEIANHIEKIGFDSNKANMFIFNMFQGWDEIVISDEGNIVNCFRKEIKKPRG